MIQHEKRGDTEEQNDGEACCHGEGIAGHARGGNLKICTRAVGAKLGCKVWKADEAAVAFWFAKARVPYCPFQGRPDFASIKHWENTCFLDHSVYKAAVD